jgi:predicted metal-dependent enzyme (double-stranded beta helix superfamily)
VAATVDVVFDTDELIADCRRAMADTEPRRAVREVLRRAVADPTAMGDALRPSVGGISLMHHAPDLTVIHVVWAPGMQLMPHDHRMWAAIAVYAGKEDNTFYRRDATAAGGIVGSGGKSLHEGDVLLLGADAVHAVSNPLTRLTAAIHVYDGDFVNQPRSQWGPGPLEERPYDYDVVLEQFAEANIRAGLE